jgi:hypothetical protein
MSIESSKELIAAIHIIWQQIAYDCGEPDDNECAVELCVDAGRLDLIRRWASCLTAAMRTWSSAGSLTRSATIARCRFSQRIRV